MSKIFILGLPRTGTTSLCAWFLEQGYKTAHTAYTQHSFDMAQVIADTPVFCDYPHLDRVFPDAKFIYLQRDIDAWLPSIQIFLSKAVLQLETNARGFNPVLSRVYAQVFDIHPGETDKINFSHLRRCWEQHRKSIEKYFEQRQSQLLTLDLSETFAREKLSGFLGIPLEGMSVIPKLNNDGRVIAWDKIKHPLKIPSNAAGPLRRKYFDF
ncbi:hypothetical protein TDB9533_02648 [Thalassocella blandensis]|nr:hypothetical protein TDB9533_02648 [Thalassocella blandensis]